MTIAGFCDIHGNLEHLRHAQAVLAAADVVVLGGDIGRFQGPDPDGPRIVDFACDHSATLLTVMGNCDQPALVALLDTCGLNLHARCQVVGEVSFLGLGGSLPCPSPTHTEYAEPELAGFLAQAWTQAPHGLPIVLLSHQPPFRTALDRLADGTAVGSRAVREFILRHQPRACLCGHLHEAAGIDHLGTTVLLNPGPLARGGYAWLELVEGEIRTAEIRHLEHLPHA